MFRNSVYAFEYSTYLYLLLNILNLYSIFVVLKYFANHYSHSSCLCLLSVVFFITMASLKILDIIIIFPYICPWVLINKVELTLTFCFPIIQHWYHWGWSTMAGGMVDWISSGVALCLVFDNTFFLLSKTFTR